MGPGGCPLLLKWPLLPLPLLPLPTGFLFVPEPWSHLPLVLFVKCRRENQKELGECPQGLAPRERNDLGT